MGALQCVHQQGARGSREPSEAGGGRWLPVAPSFPLEQAPAAGLRSGPCGPDRTAPETDPQTGREMQVGWGGGAKKGTDKSKMRDREGGQENGDWSQ